MPKIVYVDCKKSGYLREQWIIEQRCLMKYVHDIEPFYDWNGSKVMWFFPDDKEKEAGEMSTIWSLKDQNYRTSYQKHIQTFFWVDEQFYDDNRKEILEWAARYGCKVPSKRYGWIEMPNHKVELLFRLTWAGKVYG